MIRLVKILVVLIIVAGAAEIFLRKYWGFCDAVLLRSDSLFEYIPLPDQDRVRFGNKISYNSFSMRSEEVKNPSMIFIGFGDSVLNGGSQTHQDSLCSTLLSEALSTSFKRSVQFLNVSAGSWGPDNCYAYLEKHGDFEARGILLFVSSHDAYDNMTFEQMVGVNPSFPDKQYGLALIELWDRYMKPRLGFASETTKNSESGLGINKRTSTSSFNSGFEHFFHYSQEHEIPLAIYLHADQSELSSGTYNQQGMEIVHFARARNIPLLTDLANGLAMTDFRDNIHLNEAGQRKMAQIILASWEQIFPILK